MKNKLIIFSIFILFISIAISSCSIEPIVANQAETKISNISDARAMMNGAYNRMVNYRYWGRNMILVGEVRSDNMFSNAFSQRFPTWSQMLVPETDRWTDELFNYAYASLATPNIILNSDLDGMEGGSQADINYLLGEAYAIRAMVHFDLIRAFGQTYINGGSNLGVTYIKSFKEEDSHIPRNTIEENKSDIKSDIAKAIEHFNNASGSSYAKKTVFTLDAVYALKSRVGIYFKEYDYAYEGSSMLISKYPITPANQLIEYWESDIIGAGSIFELAQNEIDRQGAESISYIYRGPLYGDVEAFPNLISDIGFDTNDIRGSQAMIDYDHLNRLRNMGKYPAKDSDGYDNIKIFRIEEVILNHAESLLLGSQNNNPSLARDFLNEITSNRGANAYQGTITIDDILLERRKELLFEGFRLHDLARYNRDIRDISPNTVNNHGLVKAGSYRFTLPIPRHELDSNREMIQNPLSD